MEHARVNVDQLSYLFFDDVSGRWREGRKQCASVLPVRFIALRVRY